MDEDFSPYSCVFVSILTLHLRFHTRIPVEFHFPSPFSMFHFQELLPELWHVYMYRIYVKYGIQQSALKMVFTFITARTR